MIYLFTGIAYAGALAPQGSQAAGGGMMQNLAQFLPIIVIFGVFYFLLIRPQQKKQKETKEMLSSIKKGDKAITNGGIHGTVVELAEHTLTLKIADKVNVKFQRSAVVSLPNKKPKDK